MVVKINVTSKLNMEKHGGEILEERNVNVNEIWKK